MKFFTSHKNLQIGMTLTETVIIVSIYSVLLLTISTSIVNLYKINGYNIAQSYEIDHARRGLQSWLADTKEMTYADDGTFPIARMEPHRIGFYSDTDFDYSVEYMEFILASTTLYKYTYEATGVPPVYNLTTPSQTEVLSEYVQNINQSLSTFTYYDNAGVELSTTTAMLTDVRYIEARIVVNIDPLRSPGEFLLRSGVTPRNLKDNL